MSHYRISDSGRILPGEVENEIHRLPMRMVGGALIAMAVIGWISLLTWSISDPSLNRATGGTPNNLLGSTGASLADTLFQMLGLGAITLFLPPAAWGLALMSGERVTNPRHRLAMWTLSLIFIASTLSMLPQPSGWLLTHGLGGVIGDFGRSFFLNVGGFLNHQAAGAVGGTVAGVLGIITLLRAAGMGNQDLGMLWQSRGQRRGQRRGSLLKAALALAFAGLRALARGFRALLERASISKRPGGKVYWQPEDPNRFAPSRAVDGSFNPRFGGYGHEEEALDFPHPRGRFEIEARSSKALKPLAK
ncbi:DNA translocase FtsK 4TM domain-containing protein, partial [Rhodomicrobium sp. R_RK_3]|uniref:DNA translocase FtsK 4TM domain-containing protein n=1 Tax=Rhodomicrobium sp. R_RK_3 TaxID=2029567 RepID=UPI001AECF87A